MKNKVEFLPENRMSESLTPHKEKRTLLIIYVLAIYILLQLSWWGYQLIQLNGEVLKLKSVIPGQSQYPLLLSKIWMVVGEGSVFLLLLILGFWYIKRTVIRELRLARMEKNFLLSVTHELKTPIAAVKLQLETLKSRQLSAEQAAGLISDALRETRRLQTLSENILMATRLEQRHGALMREKLDFSALVKQELKRFKNISEAEFQAEMTDELFISGDEQMLHALVANLLENAIKYGALGKINVLLKLHNGQIHFEVADFGAGIPDDEKQKVFGKFYRMGNEETRTAKGTGLGLFICANIVKLHQGKIFIKNNQPTGSIFVVTFAME